MELTLPIATHYTIKDYKLKKNVISIHEIIKMKQIYVDLMTVNNSLFKWSSWITHCMNSKFQYDIIQHYRMAYYRDIHVDSNLPLMYFPHPDAAAASSVAHNTLASV